MSLGVNLLPNESKLCNFNCIYCECGWNVKGVRPGFNDRATVNRLLREKLTEMSEAGTPPDVITFAGNGEPTIHPKFPEIIGDTIALRDELCPSAGISVLTNGTMICREKIREALLKVDNNIVKLDSAFDDTVRLIDNPQGDYSVVRTAECMKAFGGKIIIQTMFLRGTYNGQVVDNTTDREIDAWLAVIADVRPSKVMVYTIDRDTPAEGLEKVTVAEMEKIAERIRELGIECSVSG